MSTISIRNLEKKYGSLPVLKGINLDVQDGELLTLIGPSGCGKSTLLKLIAGLEDVNSGDISIGGEDVTSIPPQERGLAMVFQNYALYPQMTVRQNLAFSLKISGMPKVEIDKRTDEIARMLEIHEYLDRRPRQLSGGQRQRVAMGRAMVREPKAFLMDEPLSNLDAALRNTMRSEIKALHKRLGRTMVYVTHDQIEAMTMADRIAIMKDGEIVQLGAPDDLYMRPANTFVAGFFGTPQINLWNAVVSGKDNQSVSFKINETTTFSANVADLKDNRDLKVGIRPEALRFADRGIPVKIALVEPTGSQTEVLVEFGDEVKGSVLVPGRFKIEVGSTVYIDPNIEDIHLFDSATGARIN